MATNKKGSIGELFNQIQKSKELKPSKSNNWTTKEGRLILESLAQKYGLLLEEEVVFDSIRQYRFDYCFESLKIAIEFDGGVWSKKPMGHNTGEGITRDIEKGNLAQLKGYVFLRFTYQQKKSYLLDTVEQIIKNKLHANNNNQS